MWPVNTQWVWATMGARSLSICRPSPIYSPLMLLEFSLSVCQKREREREREIMYKHEKLYKRIQVNSPSEPHCPGGFNSLYFCKSNVVSCSKHIWALINYVILCMCVCVFTPACTKPIFLYCQQTHEMLDTWWLGMCVHRGFPDTPVG